MEWYCYFREQTKNFSATYVGVKHIQSTSVCYEEINTVISYERAVSIKAIYVWQMNKAQRGGPYS